MDYCSTCRRHLNGALVCPGCGAYAPDIAPRADGGGHSVHATATATALPSTATVTARPAGAAPPGPAPDETPAEAPAFGAADLPPETSAASGTGTGTGRAARRRQLARWKKTQRRALVATAVALAGGGLTLASTDGGSTDRARAAGAPDVRGMGGGATDPADGSTGPGSPSASPDRTPHPPPAGDGSRAPDAAAPAATAGGPVTRTEPVSPPRTTAPDSVSRSGDRVSEAPDTVPDAGRGQAPGTGGAALPTAPPPAADDGTGGTGRGGESRPAPSTPATTAPETGTENPTDSSRLCLLVICLG
ncbi:SCO2400 family protein [Streptomyces griseoflavus]|uniref:SCO2400 family protein n=1 Tax=Streptomyces griseoflavus TaxID=35619 RepID=UPI003D745F70